MRREKEIEWPWCTNIYLERDDLEKLHTRELIWMIHRSCMHQYEHKDGWVNYTWNMGINWWYNEEMLRDILKHRPHMPNKKESIAIRKAKIAQNKKKTKRKFIVSSKRPKPSKHFLERWGYLYK